MKVCLSFISSITIIALSLSACSVSRTGEPADFPHSSETNAVEPEGKSTNIAQSVQPISTKQQTLVPTPTVHQPTWTAQPTLTGNVAIEALNNMIATNGGCKLPCFWGITPGETSWENALILLSRFSPNINSSEPNTFLRDGNTYHNSITHYVNYEIPNSRVGRGASIVVLDDVVSVIHVGNDSTGEIFDIPNLLFEYGEPTSVFIETHSNTPTGILPFYIVLFYPRNRFTAVFEFEGNKVDEMIRVCYKPSTPRIYIWSPEEDKYIEVAGFSALVPGEWTNSKSLETSTDLDVKVFYQRFINATSNICFETPSSLW